MTIRNADGHQVMHRRLPDGTVQELVSDGGFQVHGLPPLTTEVGPLDLEAPAVLRAMQHRQPLDYEYETAAAAMVAAGWMFELNEANPQQIEQQGKRVATRDQLFTEYQRMRARGDFGA